MYCGVIFIISKQINDKIALNNFYKISIKIENIY